jgi:CHASE2 domain-containing sensor protein
MLSGGAKMEAPGTLLLIFAAVVVWLFVTLFLALLRQPRRSPLRTMLLVAATLVTLVAVGLGLICYTVG